MRKEIFQSVKITGEPQTLDVFCFVFFAQWIEPVRHVTVINLFREKFPLFCDCAEGDIGCFMIVVITDQLQQLRLGEHQGFDIPAQEIILCLFEEPDIPVI